MCTVVKMMYYTVAIATFFLFGVVTAQTSLQIASCLTKDQNLQMTCKFVPDSSPKSSKICYYMTENKMIGSTNISSVPDSTFKNRATVSISSTTCDLLLKGFSDDKPKNYTCFVRQNSLASTYQTVDKSKLQVCSASCVVQHSGLALLLAFLIFPLLSEIL